MMRRRLAVVSAVVVVVAVGGIIWASGQAGTSSSCDAWMESKLLPLFDSGSPDPGSLAEIRDTCDSKTFIALNDLYAKDKNRVYFRPQLVNHFEVWVVEGADPISFELVERCSPGHGIDNERVYYMSEILEDKDPFVFDTFDVDNPASWCT